MVFNVIRRFGRPNSIETVFFSYL